MSRGQLGLQSGFQDSQNYVMGDPVSKTKQANKQKTNTEALISECEFDRYVYLNIAFKIYM